MNTLSRIKAVTILCATALAFIAGCATKPATPGKQYAMFPLPPDQPRIQYLTSFGTDADLGAKSGSFKNFVVGGQKAVKPIIKPYGVAARNGKVYVCDTQMKVVSMIDLSKRDLTFVRPTGLSTLKMPINVAADADGTFYVTDTVRRQVLIFAKDGTPQGVLAESTDMKPCGVAVSADRVFVSDLSNHCVRVYNKASRELLFQVPRKDSKDEKGKLFSPTNVAVDKNGRIIVSDSGGFTVQVYDADGKHLRTIGEQGLNVGSFTLPKGVGVDHDGRIYVVDSATAVVQMFDADGHLLMYFGDPHSSGDAGLYLPAGIAVDYDNVKYYDEFVAPGHRIEYLIYVVNQAGPNKVSVFGFLAPK